MPDEVKKPSGSSRPKAAKIRDGVEDLILTWFKMFNKPATVQSMTDALQSKVSKALVEKTLELLVESKQVLVKEFKKIRVFYLDQTQLQLDDTANSEAEVKAQLVSEADTLEKRCGSLSATLAALQQLPTPEEASAMERLLRANIAKVQGELKSISAGSGRTTNGPTMKEAAKQYHTMREEWRTRKAMTFAILDALSQHGGTRAELIAEFGLTTDDAVHVSWSASAVDIPAKFKCM